MLPSVWPGRQWLIKHTVFSIHCALIFFGCQTKLADCALVPRPYAIHTMSNCPVKGCLLRHLHKLAWPVRVMLFVCIHYNKCVTIRAIPFNCWQDWNDKKTIFQFLFLWLNHHQYIKIIARLIVASMPRTGSPNFEHLSAFPGPRHLQIEFPCILMILNLNWAAP